MTARALPGRLNTGWTGSAHRAGSQGEIPLRRKHRHELKQNELLVWLDQTSRWFADNRRSLTVVVAVVVVAGLLTAGILSYRSNQEQAAQALFAEAMEVYHAPLTEAESAVTGDEGRTFTSAEERYQTALEAFEEVIAEHEDTNAGRQARYYAGLCLTALERHDEAIERFESVRQGERDLVYYLATQSLAGAKARNGEAAEAVEVYRQLVGDPGNPLPKDRHLYDMARLQEGAGQLEEAHQTYERLLEEFPDSQLRGEVRQRSDLLQYRLST